MIKIPYEIIQGHQQIHPKSCVPMSVEFVLKYEKQMDISNFGLQEDLAKHGNSNWVDGYKHGNIEFSRPVEFYNKRGANFPFEALYSKIISELSEDRLVIISLLESDGDFHNYVIYDCDSKNGELIATTKGRPNSNNVWERVQQINGTDILIYKKLK
ncbi:MAG TPA: hypothetical protein VK806_01250 [Bacteroidia bacterium]|jgi:hypothetical protein|nr:hypothetical protein [Bacteroidia bacterium]